MRTNNKKSNVLEKLETDKIQVVSVKKEINNTKSIKYHYCFYCGKMNTKIWRHWIRCKTEKLKKEWFQIQSLPKGSKERKLKIGQLINLGDQKHNENVKKDGKGYIVTKRRPKDENIQMKQYMNCKMCNGMIKKTNLTRHSKICPQREKNYEKGCYTDEQKKPA